VKNLRQVRQPPILWPNRCNSSPDQCSCSCSCSCSVQFSSVQFSSGARFSIQMHSGKLNSTELNWIVQFSSVEFSSVFRCALIPLNLRRAATTDDGRRSLVGSRVLTVKNRRQPSQAVAGFRPTTDIALIGRFARVYPNCEEPATAANFVAEQFS